MRLAAIMFAYRSWSTLTGMNGDWTDLSQKTDPAVE